MVLSYLVSIYKYFFESKSTDNASYDIIPAMKTLGYYNISISTEQQYKLREMLTKLVGYDSDIGEYSNINDYKNLTLAEIIELLKKTDEYADFTKSLYKDVERGIYLSRYLMNNYTRANYFEFLNELNNRELNIIETSKF